MEKEVEIEYWRESALDWLRIAEAEKIPGTKLFCCNCAEDSLDKMDAKIAVASKNAPITDGVKK